ncbi:hypothetical protein U1Q18_025460, partial [Sarracenia purpurea var. burkii]
TVDGEPLDSPENIDAFQHENITNVISIEIRDNITYHRDGVEDHATIVIGSSSNFEGDNSDCEEDGERHDIPDLVIDVDMDYDSM